MKILKYTLSALIAVALAGILALVIASANVNIAFLEKIDLKYFVFACPVLCLLLACVGVNLKIKIKFWIALALLVSVVADLFLVLGLLKSQNVEIGVYVLCGVQICFALYMLFKCKSVGMMIFNIALRVALSLLAYVIVPKYVALSTVQLVYLIYLANSAVTLLFFLFELRKHWILSLGFVLLFVSDIFLGFNLGFVNMLNLSGSFLNLLAQFDFYLLFRVLGLFAISLSVVWDNKI